jgi:hypothetical protein
VVTSLWGSGGLGLVFGNLTLCSFSTATVATTDDDSVVKGCLLGQRSAPEAPDQVLQEPSQHSRLEPPW